MCKAVQWMLILVTFLVVSFLRYFMTPEQSQYAGKTGGVNSGIDTVINTKYSAPCPLLYNVLINPKGFFDDDLNFHSADMVRCCDSQCSSLCQCCSIHERGYIPEYKIDGIQASNGRTTCCDHLCTQWCQFKELRISLEGLTSSMNPSRSRSWIYIV